MDSGLGAVATIGAVTNWDAHDLAVTLNATAAAVAQEAEQAYADMFGGEVAATLTAGAVRHVFSDTILVTIATVPHPDAVRNVVVDADLPANVTFDATRSSRIEVDAITLEVTATLTRPAATKGLLAYTDTPITVVVNADVTYGQGLNADAVIATNFTVGTSQQQPLDADLAITVQPTTIFIRNQFVNSDNLALAAIVDSSVLFGALADTDLTATASRGGEIIRNHPIDVPLDVTAEVTGGVIFDALADTDTPVTATPDIVFRRDAYFGADLAVTVDSMVVMYNHTEDESQLFLTTTATGEVFRHQSIDADLAVTVTPESDPLYNQFLDADLPITVTFDVTGTHNQFLDSDSPIQVTTIGGVGWYAGAEADLTATTSSHGDFIKGMGLDSLLALLAPTEERLRSDLYSNSDLGVLSGDAPNINMGRILDADQSVIATPDDLLNSESILEALLAVTETPATNISDLLSSNFFPFYL